MLAECRRRPDQRFGPLNLQFRWQTRLAQYPGFGPLRGSKVVSCGKMLCQCASSASHRSSPTGAGSSCSSNG